MAFGEAILSAVLKEVVSKLASPVFSELGKLYHVKDELRRLQRTLVRLQAMLRDMERRQISDEHLALWLQELKDAAYDAEDLLDEFEYEDLRRKDVDDVGRCGPLLQLLAKTQVRNYLFSCLNPRGLLLRRSMAHRIDELRRRLDDIAKDRNDLRVVEELGGRPDPDEYSCTSRRRPTPAILGEVFGMEAEKEEVLKFLLASSRDNNIDVGASSSSSVDARHTHVPVIAIVGMGGVGKTTLAQLVYNDGRVKEYFDRRMWVWVSDDLNIEKLSKQMLEHFGDHLANLNIENQSVLQEKLRDRLKGTRFLLVLDDVWEENHSKWRYVHALLINGEKDSKVIVTTRNIKRLPSAVRTTKIVVLKEMGFQQCWSIFKSCAFEDGISGKHPRLEAIGKDIVKKLEGLPLAATTVGGSLRGELEERQWRKVLESKLWELGRGEGGIFPALRLSYEHLPPHLKQCFAYFSLYPKDWIFHKDELVQQWIAQGFLQYSQGRERMEDVGSDYFDDLLTRSLIQLVDGKFVIHNLLHALAQLVSQPHYSYIRIQEVGTITKDVCHLRHLSLSIPKEQPDAKDLENLYKFGRLRTIIFWFRYSSTRLRVPPDLFINIRCLRVLDICAGGVEILPACIGKLKHLRYLDLRRNPIKELPTSLCSIYRLQTLKLNGCHQLIRLPIGMSNLTNLRHLEVEADIISRMVGIGKLTNLQKLEVFRLSDANGISISDLKDLNDLGGKLCIQNLERVTSKEEASQARLNQKLCLSTLEMEWGHDGDDDGRKNGLEELVLEGLLPPPNLKQLEIKHYGGSRYPAWMEDQSISQLESICLEGCRRWNALPSLRQLPFLRVLNIAHCPQLKELPLLPTTLLRLSLLDVGLSALPGLQELQLQELEISDNLELREASHIPVTLRELRIKNVPLMESLPAFWRFQEATRQGTSDSGPSLSILKIQSCPRLTSLKEGLLQHHLQGLRILSIIDCPELVQWPEGEGIRATLLSIEDELCLENCPKLMAFPEGCVLSASLKKLTVRDCPYVPDSSLFIQLHNLTSKDVYVEKEYQKFTSSCNEALQHVRELDVLDIRYAQHDDGTDDQLLSRQRGSSDFLGKLLNDWETMLEELLSGIDADDDDINAFNLSCHPFPKDDDEECPVAVSLVYDRLSLSCIGLDDAVLTRQIKVTIWSNAPNQKSTKGSLFRCLRSCHESASSLRWLAISGFPSDELIHVPGEGSPLPHLPSLLSLVFRNCRGIRRLPMGTLLCQLSSLRELSIMNCPEMLLSSVDEAIHSLPSIRKLAILECPNLLSGKGCDDLHSGTGRSLSSCASSSSMPPPVPLQSLTVDDLNLLRDRYFVCNHLTSLHELRLWEVGLSSFMAIDVDTVRSIAGPVEILEFLKCSSLPSEMGSLFPSLKRLQIEECPEIRCMPERGLPHSLERLEITDCPTLAERCRPPREDEDSEGEDATGSLHDMSSDWQLVARIPNIEIDGRIVQGSWRNS